MAAQWGRTQAEHIFSGKADLCAYGETHWESVHTDWRSTWPVAGVGIEPGDLSFQCVYRPLRASEPTVLLVFRRVNLARVDVNGTHRGRQYSHVQRRYEPDGACETEPVPGSFPQIELAPQIEPELLWRVTHEAASLLQVDINGITGWQTPPPEVGGFSR